MGIMEINEIEKALYKERPVAKETDDGVSGIRGATAITGSRYETTLANGTKVEFFVPHHEMGEKKFEKELSAQFLRRWIIRE